MPEIRNIINHKGEVVEKTLQEVIEYFEPSISTTLIEAMKYSLFSGGKRIRPIMTVMTAEIVNGNKEIAYHIGSTIELIHTYSLIHDDLPSMDDDDFRRGKKSNHKVYGPGIAVLAGDGLLTSAFEYISNLDLESKKLLKIIQVISKGAGVNGMVGGQVLDLQSEGIQVGTDKLKTIHKAKTGGLFKAAILSGAYTGKIDKKQIEALEQYAKNIGLLFQITDDILDVIGDKEKMGKAVGSDSRLEKSTYPEIFGLKRAQKEASKIALEAKKCLDIFGDSANDLKDLINFILKRDH